MSTIDLQEIREQLDKVDKKLTELFEERMRLCSDVAELKIATGKPVLHLAVSESDPTLPYLARYPLALVLHAGEGVTPGVVAKLDKWLHDVKGKHLPFAEVAKLYPEFTPEKVAEAFLRGM